LGPDPRLTKEEFTGPRSHEGWETPLYSTPSTVPNTYFNIQHLSIWSNHLCVRKVLTIKGQQGHG